MTPATVAAALKALDIIEAEPERRARLWTSPRRCTTASGRWASTPASRSRPVVPVLIGDQVKCFRFWKALFEAGVFTNPVIPPAVEPGHALLRTSYMATHTDAQLDRVLDVFEKIGRKMGIIPETRPDHLRPGEGRPPGHLRRRTTRPRSAGRPPGGVLADRGLPLEAASRAAVLAREWPASCSTRWRRSPGAPPTSSPTTLQAPRPDAAPAVGASAREHPRADCWRRAPTSSSKNGHAGPGALEASPWPLAAREV